jgi:molybdopterin synthase sulfur carrier subunit
MKIEVLYFAQLKEITGREQEDMEFNSGATVSDILEKVKSLYGADIRGLKVAINEEFADLSKSLHEGDSAALLPPVSGG